MLIVKKFETGSDYQFPTFIGSPGIPGEFAGFSASVPELASKINKKEFSINSIEIQLIDYNAPYMGDLSFIVSDWQYSSSPDILSLEYGTGLFGGDLVCHYIDGCEATGGSLSFQDHIEDLLFNGAYFPVIPVFESGNDYTGSNFEFIVATDVNVIIDASPVNEAGIGLLMSLAIFGVMLVSKFRKK